MQTLHQRFSQISPCPSCDISNVNFTIVNNVVISHPISFTAQAISSSQIDLTFTPNSNNNNVIIVWNQTGTFTTPVGAPPVVGQPFSGGTLLYNGTVSPLNHTGLTQLTTYYYKAFSYNGTNYSSGVNASATTLSALDFGVNLLVFDNCANSVPLVFGTAPGATDCYDVGLDISAPPPPPAGAFDARFVSCNEHWFTDIRATNISDERVWQILYTPATGCSPVSFSWNPSQLPVNGYFHLVDPIYGYLININMRTRNSYTDTFGYGQVLINPKESAAALKKMVFEMERRYMVLAERGARNIESYNLQARDEDQLPYLVIIIDELADLMFTAPAEVEDSITRLAQMGRASGIHLILATQRPSVDVITGIIKANFPARLSFQVSSKVDSRTILDTHGAEQLLGKGDMLLMLPGARIIRVHGALITEAEIQAATEFIKTQGRPIIRLWRAYRIWKNRMMMKNMPRETRCI